jgi:hypothetical protein
MSFAASTLDCTRQQRMGTFELPEQSPNNRFQGRPPLRGVRPEPKRWATETNMIRPLCALALSALLAACATSTVPPSDSMARPIPSRNIADENQRAASYLGELAAIEEIPRRLLVACKQADPEGDEARQAAYEQWKQANNETLTRSHSYAETIMPRLLPNPPPGRTAIELFKAQQTLEMDRTLYFMEPAKKLDACKHYTTTLFKDHSALVREAFAGLDMWLGKNP